MAAEPTPAGWTMSPPDNQTAQPNSSLATQIQVIGILEIIWGSLIGVVSLLILVSFLIGSAASSYGGAPDFVPRFLAGLGFLLFLIPAALSILAILAGAFLVQRKPAGRTLSYVCAGLAVVGFPIGTAFAVWTFITMSNQDTPRILVR